MGNILSSFKMRGKNTIYGNKDACCQCPNSCTSGKSPNTVNLDPNTKFVPVKMYGNPNLKLNPIPKEDAVNPFNHTLVRKDYVPKKLFSGLGKISIRLKSECACLSIPLER